EQLRKLLLEHGDFKKVEGVLQRWYEQKKVEKEGGGYCTKERLMQVKESGNRVSFESSFSMDVPQLHELDPECSLLDAQNESFFNDDAGKAEQTNDAEATAQAGASFKKLG
ncbi:unnamed protein product, partial [Symbiodinium pilosum]